MFGLAEPGGGVVTGDALSDVEVSVGVVPGFYFGATYSRFTTDGGEEWYYGGEFDHETIGGFLLAEFLPTSALTPYARVGMSAVTTQAGETSEQFTTGAFAGLRGCVYLTTFLSLSIETQFQFLDLADDAGLDERAHGWRVLVGAELWWSPGK